jgi:large subunit ribosomal protein L18
MRRIQEKLRRRRRRRFSIRKRVLGTKVRPRITVYRSNRYTYVQAVDDEAGATLASSSNLEKELRDVKNDLVRIGKLGQVLGEKIKRMSIKRAVFDRNGYLYHGLVKAVADGIRKAGIEF